MNAPYKPTHTMRVFLFDSHLLCEGYCATPSLKQIVRDFATMCYKFHMPLCRGTEMRVEEVVTAKGDERTLFFPNASLHQRLDGSRKIVITQTMRNASKELEGAHMPIEERFLLLSWKRHDKRPARVGQMHHEDLHLLLHSCQNDLGFSPVDLGVLSRLKF